MPRYGGRGAGGVEGKGKEVHVTRPGGSRGGARLRRGTWEPVCPKDLKPNKLEEMVVGAPGLMPPHPLV